jgi:MoaA/NifB/PqqE/SkfB family radical SAM enzyme
MTESVHHITTESWLKTPLGDNRGYIQPGALTELWFHTGTICNLSCPFCLEGSKPGDNRLNRITFDDARPFIDEAVQLGVKQFSFTGGEPFVIKDIIHILSYALEFNPCLVLTNGTDPILKRMSDLSPLLDRPHQVSFRISIDWPDPAKHDEGRGAGSFEKSFQAMKALSEMGFKVSLARHMQAGEDKAEADGEYRTLLRDRGIDDSLTIVAFPDFHSPGSLVDVPYITEDCMTRYHTEESRAGFMCSFSRMIVKKDGQMRVYSCTLVDDDEEYDTGATLKESLPVRVMMKHHRCYSCFAHGASCSET